jgi:3-oxoacyl-[acyl-carrier-protein] synthase II
MSDQVVITGMGAVTPIGDTIESFWAANLAGKSGLVRETRMDLSALPCGWTAGLIPDDIKQRVMERWGGPGRQWYDMLMHAAVDQALADAGCDGHVDGPVGLLWTRVGAGAGGPFPEDYVTHMKSLAKRYEIAGDNPAVVLDYLRRQSAHRPEGVEASSYPREISERLSAPVISVKLDATCAGGLRAVAEACRLLRLGKVRFAIVSASTSRCTPYVLSQYAQLMALSRWKGRPEQSSMPFDRRRSGMVINESAGALVLEREEDAARRGVGTAHAVVSGWGLAVDSSHVTKPQAEMIERVINTALATSQTAPSDVDAINAHGTSTRLNDLMEAQGLHSVFGDRAREIDICAVKSLTGHGSATSGVTESAIAALMLCRGVVPPVATCTEPDPACDVKTSTVPVERPVGVVLKNSFGFGGQYASMVYKRPSNPRPAPSLAA